MAFDDPWMIRRQFLSASSLAANLASRSARTAASTDLRSMPVGSATPSLSRRQPERVMLRIVGGIDRHQRHHGRGRYSPRPHLEHEGHVARQSEVKGDRGRKPDKAVLQHCGGQRAERADGEYGEHPPSPDGGASARFQLRGVHPRYRGEEILRAGEVARRVERRPAPALEERRQQECCPDSPDE